MVLKNIWTLIFCSEYPPMFQKWYRKLNPSLLHWATGFFSSYGLVEKYFNIDILIVSPRFQKWYWNSIRSFSIGLRLFSKMICRIWREYFSWIFKCPFFTSQNIFTKIIYWTSLASVGQSVHRNLQSFSQTSPNSVSGISGLSLLKNTYIACTTKTKLYFAHLYVKIYQKNIRLKSHITKDNMFITFYWVS